MTTTGNNLDAAKFIGRSASGRLVDWRDKRSVAPVPWSELAPSDYAFLALWSSFNPPRMVSEKDMVGSALLAAILAMVETRAAHLMIKDEEHFFGLFFSRRVWISKGDSDETWPEGSIESNLQNGLQKYPKKFPIRVSDLVAEWIGCERPSPWREMLDRILDRLVSQGTIDRRQRKESILFFRWEKTIHMPSLRMDKTLANYVNESRRRGFGLPLQDHVAQRSGQRESISGEINRGFTDRTESNDD